MTVFIGTVPFGDAEKARLLVLRGRVQAGELRDDSPEVEPIVPAPVEPVQ